MSQRKGKLVEQVKQFADAQYKNFTRDYGQQVIDIFEFPLRLVLSPFTIAYGIAGSAPRGFGIPEFISKVSYTTIFVSFCSNPCLISINISGFWKFWALGW